VPPAILPATGAASRNSLINGWLARTNDRCKSYPDHYAQQLAQGIDTYPAQ
jgi:hypothetical protein